MSWDEQLTVAVDCWLGIMKVVAQGELDLATAPQLLRAYRRFQRASRSVFLDLSGVTFVDVAGVRAMIALHADCEQHDRKLTVVASPAVTELISLCELESLFPSQAPHVHITPGVPRGS